MSEVPEAPSSGSRDAGFGLRLGVWLLLPLLGIQVHFVSLGWQLVGYGVFLLPYMFLLIVNRAAVERAASPLLRDEVGSAALGRLFSLLIILVLVASLRAVSSEHHSGARFLVHVVTFSVFIAFLRMYVLHMAALGQLALIWKDLAISGILAALTALSGYFLLGLQGPQAAVYTEEIEARISLLRYRVSFPFITSNRGFSQYSGLLVILCAGALGYRRRGAPLFKGMLVPMFGVAVGLLAISFTDSRMTLFATILSVVALGVFGLTKHRRKLLALTVGLILLFPAYYFYFLLRYELLLEGPISLTGRLYIWGTALLSLPTYGTGPLIVGHGLNSHTRLGLNNEYGVLFENWSGTELIPFHNASFQMIYDTGVLGLVTFFGLIIVLAWSVADQRTVESPAQKRFQVMALVLLVYYLALGVTESTVIQYFPHLLFVLTLLRYAIPLARQNPARLEEALGPSMGEA